MAAAVHGAAEKNDVEALHGLLDSNPELADTEAEHGRVRCRPLHVACKAGSLEAVYTLLDRGAGIDQTDAFGDTPIMWACAAGRVEVVRLLLLRGADPTLRGYRQRTVLMHAAMDARCPGSDHVGVLRLLIKDGRVPVNARDEEHERGSYWGFDDDYGCTALWWACRQGLRERARVLLMEGGADHTIVDQCGRTPKGVAMQSCVRLMEWYEGEVEKTFLLSKARAVVDATESITRAPEKVRAKTKGQKQRAREEAAPAYLKERVKKGKALPAVELVEHGWKRGRVEEERGAVLERVVKWMQQDLYVEMMQGLRFR